MSFLKKLLTECNPGKKQPVRKQYQHCQKHFSQSGYNRKRKPGIVPLWSRPRTPRKVHEHLTIFSGLHPGQIRKKPVKTRQLLQAAGQWGYQLWHLPGFFPGNCTGLKQSQWEWQSEECTGTSGTPTNSSLASSLLTTCSKTLASCDDYNNTTRYGGFPGVPTKRVFWYR